LERLFERGFQTEVRPTEQAVIQIVALVQRSECRFLQICTAMAWVTLTMYSSSYRLIQLGAFAEELWSSQKCAACVCQSHSAQLPPSCVRPPLSTLSLFPASQMAAKMMGAKLGLGLGGSRLLLQQSAARSGTRRPLSIVAASTPEREVMERLPGELLTRHPTPAVLFSTQPA
jgi:hypothetical protein